MDFGNRIDLHMHSTVSDGTDTPGEIIARVREAGIKLFAVTDHDAVKGARIIRGLLEEGDPAFLTGIELSCRDEEGKYHILGYDYDPDAGSMRAIVEKVHSLRMKKVIARLDFLKVRYGIIFPDEEIRALLALDNPGKPHIGNLMVKYGYAESRGQAIREFINKVRFRSEYIRPEEAISAILEAGGVPVLAHPIYGDGDQLIIGEEMDARIRKLVGYGLEGLEAFYSGFTPKMRNELLEAAEKYELYVTCGSDYHGTNKLIEIGDTGLTDDMEQPEGLVRFVRRTAHDDK